MQAKDYLVHTSYCVWLSGSKLLEPQWQFPFEDQCGDVETSVGDSGRCFQVLSSIDLSIDYWSGSP